MQKKIETQYKFFLSFAQIMTSTKKYLLVVGGPTASGKTMLSIQLAQHFNAPVLSADSRQFYTELEIGNARPSQEELSQASHHFIADRSVKTLLSAGEFAKEAMRFLDKHFLNHNIAILVGGSGLFLKAVTEGLNAFPEIPDEIRQKVDAVFDKEGIVGLQNALLKADPDYFKIVDKNNHSRLKRALEVCFAGEYSYSYYRTKENAEKVFIPIYLQTSWPREDLYQRINMRVDRMLKEGLEEEARNLMPFQHLSALKTVGYQEWFAYFNGEYDRDRAVELIKQNTRRYAKRQLSWFRRDGYWKQIFKGDLRSALTYIKMVQSENTVLIAPQKDSPEKEHPKYKHIYTQLGRGSNPIASTVIWKAKQAACLKKWDMKGLSHTAKNILLHESVHRAETEQVFVIVYEHEKNTFQSIGFEEVKPGLMPKCLQEETLEDKHLLVWNKSQQKF